MIDIDCTLYSYLELVFAQRFHSFELIQGVLFSKSQKIYKCADRVFICYKPHIQQRIKFLIQFFGKDHLFFYSADPITPAKQDLLSEMGVRFASSFPHKKTSQEVQKIYGKSPQLVVGDRMIDRQLAQSFNATWKGAPYYDHHHLLLGSSYTHFFKSLIQKT